MMRFIGPEFITNHKNVFKERRMQFLADKDQQVVCPVFGWVVFDMAELSVVCGWYGWFVADLWV